MIIIDFSISKSIVGIFYLGIGGKRNRKGHRILQALEMGLTSERNLNFVTFSCTAPGFALLLFIFNFPTIQHCITTQSVAKETSHSFPFNQIFSLVFHRLCRPG